MSLLLKKSACRGHSHKAPCPCKLEVDWEVSGLRERGTLGKPRKARQLDTLLSLPGLAPYFYLVNIEISLGLDSADGGRRARGLSSPLALRTGCQEQGKEQHSLRGQHGHPARDGR